MRLLVVSHNYPRRSHRGAGLFVHAVNLGMRDAGAEVDVLQLGEWSPPWPLAALDATWRRAHAHRRDLFDEVDGLRLHHPLVVQPRPSRFFHSDHWHREVDALQRYVSRLPSLRRCDAVVGHFMVPDGYHALRLGQALGVPTVAMAHGDDVHAWPAERPSWRAHLRSVLRESSALVACSRRLADDGAQWAEHPTTWHVVYSGVDVARFSPPDDRLASRARVFADRPEIAAPDKKLILVLAQPVIAKGYSDLLEAWQVLVDTVPDEWQLVMAGGGNGNIDVAAEVGRRGLAGRAHWLGPQTPDRIPELLRAADAFALPSHNEGLSLSMLEAMATGLPVVATDVGGHAEVLVDGENGWLIPPRDVGALVSALRELITSADERGRRGAAARDAARRVGSPSENGRRLLEIVQGVIARGAGQRPERAGARA